MKRSIPSTLFAALFAVLLAAGGCSESLTGPAPEAQTPAVESQTAGENDGGNTDDPDGHNTPPEE
jgi:hypothetical protein